MTSKKDNDVGSDLWDVDLPYGWKLTPIKRLAKSGYDTFTDGDWVESPYITDSGIRLIQTGNVRIGRFINKGNRYVSEESFKELDCREVHSDEVLISRLADPVGRACMAPDLDNRMIASVDVAILNTREDIDPQYVVYALSSKPYLDYTSALCRGGTMERLSRSMLGDIEIPVPPYTIQKSIVGYLNSHLDSIRAAIEELTNIRSQLANQKNSIIREYTSGGLDSGSTKPTEIGWTGDIPQHWNVVRTRFVARLKSGHTPSRSNDEYWEDTDIPWVTTSDIKPFRNGRKIYLDETENQISELGLENSGAHLLPERTVFLSRTASVGFSGIMNREMATSQDFANWICGDEILPEYLLYVFRSMDQEFDRLTQGSTHQTIYMPDIQSFKTPLPPIAEQREIVEHIQTETDRIWKLIDKVEETIDLLEEKRQALITAAVTGQIDIIETQSLETETVS